MGRVYRAFDPAIGRQVAVKTIPLDKIKTSEERQDLLDRLRREAQSAGSLSHPNIVTIHDFVELDNFACLVMEFIDGTTLKDFLRTPKGWERPAGLAVLEQTAAALDYAHSCGVVHRDIKPSNIIIAKPGAAKAQEVLVKILDFGVAKLAAAQTLTKAGYALGTPEYMSPEQFLGPAVDGKADQFALATIAYEMLAGARPFSADTPLQVMFRVTKEDPAPANDLNPSIGPAAAGVLGKGLSKNPKSRYESCADFLTALEEALAAAPGWQPGIAKTGGPSTPRELKGASAGAGESPAGGAPRSPYPDQKAPVSPPRVEVTPPRPASALTARARWRLLFVAGCLVVAMAAALGWWSSRRDSASREKASAVSPAIEKDEPVPLTVPAEQLPEGTVGSSYSRALTATGGVAPRIWALATGSLPQGLELDPSAGAIGGTPAAPGTFAFALRVTDASRNSAARDFVIRVNPKPADAVLVIETAPQLPDAVAGSEYRLALAVSGGAPPFRWNMRGGTLPPGISLDAARGALTGTPSAPGSYRFAVQVADASRAAARQPFSLSVTRVVPPLSITSAASLPGAVAGAGYSAHLSASGGELPLRWSLAGGALPPGVSLDPAQGQIQGAPSTPGTYKFTVGVADNGNGSDTRQFTMAVNRAAPAIPPGALPDASAGRTYSQPLNASGGSPPYTWSVSGGALPAGLTLDPRGVIQGTPSRPGTFQFTVGVVDTSPASANQQFSLRVVSIVRIITPSLLRTASVGRPYSHELVVSGGTAPYQWSVVSGSVPPDLSLDSAQGVIRGTPAKTGQFRFTLRVTDSAQSSAAGEFLLGVNEMQGEITWTGELDVNVPLIIQGRHASRGALSGELPGAPVKVEVVDPSGVTIVNPPGSSFGWRNMVLNSPYRRQTRIVIRWTESR